jgi:hypothetical protein
MAKKRSSTASNGAVALAALASVVACAAATAGEREWNGVEWRVWGAEAWCSALRRSQDGRSSPLSVHHRRPRGARPVEPGGERSSAQERGASRGAAWARLSGPAY